MLELVNQLLALVLPLVVVAVTTWVAASVKNDLIPFVSTWVSQRLTDAQLAFLKQVIQDAVNYAESQGINATIKLTSEQKLAAAIDWAEQVLRTRGLRVDLEVLIGLIESTWAESYGAPKLFGASLNRAVQTPAEVE